MAENVTLARPYAEAAFQLARGGNALDAWSVALSRLSAVTARPEMEECIGNPRLSPEQLARLCLDVAASDVKLTLSADQQNFVRVLADNDHLAFELAEARVRLVKFPQSSFYRVMRHKLNWGGPRRREQKGR